jgi:DNA-binding MarR family transcriptional regulator
MQTAAPMPRPAVGEDTTIPVDFGHMAQGLGFLMKVGHIVAAERNNRHFREGGLAPSVYTILKFLQANPNLRQGHLAQALRIKPAMMTKLIREFEEEGWVSRTIPDGDRRTVILRLTAAGEDRVAAADHHFSNAMQAEHGPLAPGEVSELRRLLHKFIGLGPNAVLRLPG